MRICLDTNAYSALVRGHAEIASRVREAETVALSMIVIGELLTGFRSGSRERWNRRILEDFLRSPHFKTLQVTRTTAESFSHIMAALRQRGRPIPTNDAWIAAHAVEAGMQFLSFDAHFAFIDGLDWVRPEPL